MGGYCARFVSDELRILCRDCFSSISALELKDTKALLVDDREEFTIQHLARMQPLESVVARPRGDWLFELLQDGRIFSHFQPIVEAKNPQNVFGYECLARGRTRSGEILSPKTMFSIANAADMLFHLERCCRVAAIRGAKEHGITQSLFINFNPNTIYSPEFCLKATLRAIEQAEINPACVVFEVIESEEVKDVSHILEVLDFYRDHGFRVALDDLGAGYSSLRLLSLLKPDFIKLDIGLVQHVDEDPYRAVITQNILEMARRLGVQTIAEGVETAGEWHWLREHEVDFVQGFLFARPTVPPVPVVVPV
ncbi:EAL domain-containing protein [Oleidesulfovibrio sp.]|uniref:EAL domain-containing protein n=1 Tax=Oleidesulfovibrio sp. TaxID=2909707 RepID=UPI003A86A851